MNNKIFVFNSIISIDSITKNCCVLSTQKNKITLPVFEIEQPRHLQNEIRYNTKNLFSTDLIKTIEQIIISDLEIQNELLYNYIIEEYNDNNIKYNLDKDIFLCSSIIIGNKLNNKLYWCEFNHLKDIKNMTAVESLINYLLGKSIVL